MGKRKRREAFEREALSHMDALYGMALRLTRDEHEAEDLLQDALVKAYRFFDQFQQGSNAKAWLFKVLTSTFYNRWRKRKTIQRLVIDADLGGHYDRFVSSASTAAVDPEAALLGIMGAREVEQAIGELPEDFRVVVTLADVYEFSYREIAEIIDRPVGTVMSRLYRGRHLLQARLHDHAVARGVIPAAETQGEAREAAGPEGQGGALAALDEYREHRKRKKSSP